MLLVMLPMGISLLKHPEGNYLDFLQDIKRVKGCDRRYSLFNRMDRVN